VDPGRADRAAAFQPELPGPANGRTAGHLPESAAAAEQIDRADPALRDLEAVDLLEDAS